MRSFADIHSNENQQLLTQETQDINQKINDAVDAYFKSNPDADWFAAKKLMPELILNGLFERDKKNGMPLRQILRALDKNGELDSIPRLFAERIGSDVYWYFVREGATYVSNHVSDAPNAKQKRSLERSNSDEVYLMALIDELLDATGSRKHTFDYLLGDLHQNGKTRTELAIDLYYPKLNLALEIVEHPDRMKNAIEAKEEKLTVSGITRSEQRLKYYNRKKKVLKEKDKNFIEIPLEKFDVDDTLRIVRDKENDELRGLLSQFIH
jgi:Spy/CpxP family protein refolding chaperone